MALATKKSRQAPWKRITKQVVWALLTSFLTGHSFYISVPCPYCQPHEERLDFWFPLPIHFAWNYDYRPTMGPFCYCLWISYNDEVLFKYELQHGCHQLPAYNYCDGVHERPCFLYLCDFPVDVEQGSSFVLRGQGTATLR